MGKWIGMVAWTIALALLAGWSLPAQGQVHVHLVRYQHTDAVGTPVAATDETGALVETYEYESYGLQVSGPLTGGPGYTGHVEDVATGLVYMQQRYYDPLIPRFLSVDPVTAYEDPIGAFHRYRYVNNNPYRFTDPDGRDNVLGVVANFPKNFGKPVESDLHIQAAAQRSVDLTVNAALNGSSAEIKQNVAKWSVTVDPRTPLTRTGGVASTNVDTVETTYSASIGLIADTSGTVTLSGGIKAPGGDPALLAIGGHEIGHTTTENKALPPGEEKERNASQTAIQISATSLDVEPGTIKPTADRVQR